MRKACLGVDIGSVSTKGVIIDYATSEIVSGVYILTEGDPINACLRLLSELKERAKDRVVAACGTTGSARRIAGLITKAAVVKNEITAHAVGTLQKYPDVRTIFEIGGQDSKIILLENGVVTDYAMNTLCAAGTGAFLSASAKRLGLTVEELAGLSLESKNPTPIAARCAVFAESDLVHKTQIGHAKNDIIAGICRAVAQNYLNNVCKGKKIAAPIVFQGGVSKNEGVKRAFERELGEPIKVDANGHLAGAYGAALLAKKSGQTRVFDFSALSDDFKAKAVNCVMCANNCEIIRITQNGTLIDFWGNRCEKGRAAVKKSLKTAAAP